MSRYLNRQNFYSGKNDKEFDKINEIYSFVINSKSSLLIKSNIDFELAIKLSNKLSLIKSSRYNKPIMVTSIYMPFFFDNTISAYNLFERLIKIYCNINNDFKNYNYLIIVGSITTELKLWKKLSSISKTEYYLPKLIVISNEIDDLSVHGLSLTYDIKTFPITIEYESGQNISKIYNTDLYIRAATIAFNKIKFMKKKTILIIVPSHREVMIVFEKINQSNISNLKIYLIYDDESLKKSKNQNQSDKWITIVTTSYVSSPIIYESSVVIDTFTCLNSNSDLGSEQLSKISKSMSSRHMLKTGRYTFGNYVALISETEYKSLQERLENDIPYLYLLKLKEINMNPINILEGIVETILINSKMNLLEILGFMKDKNMWNYCFKFPIGIRYAVMIYNMYLSNEPYIFLHLAVICTLNLYRSGIFYFPKNSMLYTSSIKFVNNKFKGSTTIDTIFNIWIKM